VADGGATRAESVAHGLDVLVANGACDEELVLVHDGARPLPGAPLLKRLLAASDAGDVVIPVVPMYDSLRRDIDDETTAVDRSAVVAVQTPQLLAVGVLRAAIAKASDAGRFGDEATLVEAAGGRVATVAGEVWNRKITVPEDVILAEGFLRARTEVVVGFGYDVHRFAPARALMLAGVEIPSDVGLEGTSDADAVLHAVMDAILGCSGSGDIGGMFPSSDPQYAGIASAVLLERVMKLRRTSRLRLLSLDVTIVAERPRLQKYQEAMEHRLASLLGLRAADVDVKVTGNDGVGWIGRGEGIAALCVVTALRRR
jgi:2-C-methyl-D-erythritol 2,4-cyclodiphosphate synthase